MKVRHRTLTPHSCIKVRHATHPSIILTATPLLSDMLLYLKGTLLPALALNVDVGSKSWGGQCGHNFYCTGLVERFGKGFWLWMLMSSLNFLQHLLTSGQWVWPLPSQCCDQFWMLMLPISRWFSLLSRVLDVSPLQCSLQLLLGMSQVGGAVFRCTSRDLKVLNSLW